jgi:heme/copper-type cytochrome/quinol oxidase subunit 3
MPAAPVPAAGPTVERVLKPIRSPGRWAMILLVATEGAFFAYLLFSYFYLASMARGSWPPSGSPALHLSLPNTGLLLVSSASAQWSEAAARRGNRRALLTGLLGTIVLGMMFLVIQALEYSGQHFVPSTDAYSSLFYTITGFHGLHVAVGIIMLSVVALRAWLGHFRPGHHLAVSNAVLYWHFVDVVWLAVFASLYLSPRLG